MPSIDANPIEADICLFVEGTYPYVTGGVSTWLHQLITHLPDFTFAICHLGSKLEPDRTVKYQLPENVVGFHEIFLSDVPSFGSPVPRRSPSRRWKSLQALHEQVASRSAKAEIAALRAVIEPGADYLDPPQLMFSREAWDMLVSLYRTKASSSPFLDYFWTFRSTHAPLLILNNAAFPPARLYHAVSTGYAGYAAALAKLKTDRPLLITEHGIYTRERDMEIALANWMDDAPNHFQIDTRTNFFKEWWKTMFQFMSRLTYELSDTIVSITRINQQYQVRDGANPDKLRLIPNGVDIDRFRQAQGNPPADVDSFMVGFVGRVVPIKDVKTFIQAIKIASASIPGIRAAIIGPTDEDPDYFQECQALIAQLGLDECIQFTGRANVLDYYQAMNALALTSLSEGQPLVILEANCAGIPVIASDVGACRDLLEGVTAEDRQLGPSGLLTLPASPDQTASAIFQLWKQPLLRQQMAKAGRERVARYYREEAVYKAYRDLYGSLLGGAEETERQVVAWPG